MTTLSPTFNPNEFESRDYTNPYLTDVQKESVNEVESRVNGELDFVAQMLGWSGPNYWTNLASTVSEKRQLLVGTYGVYNNFVLPEIYEIRNWNNTIVVDRLPLLTPNQSTYAEYVLLGSDKYQIQSINTEGDRYVISLGVLPESFYNQIAANVPLLVSIPAARPAPFVRNDVGVSGDASFVCSANGTDLTLYPKYDTEKKFPYRFPVIFAGSVYYFNQPIYLSYTSSLTVDISSEYDADLELWYLQIPQSLTVPQAGLTSYLVWPYSNPTVATNASLEVNIQPWVDPSDWNAENVLQNFRGVWNNKGGALPYNLVFDALSIHGFNERNSLYLPGITRTLDFNDLVTQVYSQQSTISEKPPGTANPGDLWWNSDTGVLAAWVPQNDNCSAWVEIDYRNPANLFLYGDVLFPDVPSFIAGSSTVPDGTRISILDVSGLSIAENVLGVQGTLTSPGTLTLFKVPGSQYWTPVEFLYLNVSNFNSDALNLPYQVPVLIGNSDTLQPSGVNYAISNLKQQIFGDYAVVATKYYNNRSWEISADSILKYIANSSLTGSPVQGEMWWDYAVPTPELRCASMYYQSAWVQVNSAAATGTPNPFLNLPTILFYCNGDLLTVSTTYSTEDFNLLYTVDSAAGTYTFDYTPKSLSGKTKFPTITISDNLTTTYQADISNLVFSGVQYVMSPNVYDSETPLRIWKAQDLQVVETVGHLVEDNYINPLLADLNSGPGPENWERYFVRLPLDYGRDETNWQKVVLACQDFGYWGSPIDPEKMRCPPEDDLPAIYEELFLYGQPVPDYTYVYSESYLYSNIAYAYATEPGDFRNAGVFPASDVEFDEFNEAQLVDYDPLHNRQANFSLPVGAGYGNWQGEYVNINPCVPLTGFFTTDLLNGGVQPVSPPVWDASIYKFAPTCENSAASYSVDANHYKVGYAYFVADASAAEDGFFDISQEAAWREPSPQSQSLYLLPR